MSNANATIGWAGAHQIQRTSERRSPEHAHSLALVGLLHIFFLTIPIFAIGQQNLVPNPSFEEHTQCPYNEGNLSYLVSWKKIGGDGAITHFHECGEPCCSIPVNNYQNFWGGGGYARTGQAYVDIRMWADNEAVFPLFFEGGFLGTPLLQPLVQGKKYDVAFYLSLKDSMWYAGKNIGAHFSIGQPDAAIDTLLSLVPQLRYEGDFLTDKEGWMEVSGSFIAPQGGEDFITIGNFNGYHESEVIFVGGGIPPPNLPHGWKEANYFIDDVSVVEDRGWTGIGETAEEHFGLWPNPATNAITLETDQGEAVRLYDMTGRDVFYAPLHSIKQTINIGHLPAGLYTVAVTTHDGSVVRQRMVKQ